MAVVVARLAGAPVQSVRSILKELWDASAEAFLDEKHSQQFA